MIAADHELLAAPDALLDPLAAAPAGPVGAVGALRDDALQALPAGGLEQAGAAAVPVAGGPPAGPVESELLEQLAALDVGEVPDAVAVEVQQVEDHVVDRRLGHACLDRRRRGQSHAALDQLEPRPALGVERDHLAVEDRRVIRERLGDRGELGIAGADVLEAAAQHATSGRGRRSPGRASRPT